MGVVAAFRPAFGAILRIPLKKCKHHVCCTFGIQYGSAAPSFRGHIGSNFPKQMQAIVPEYPDFELASCHAASPILPGCLHRFFRTRNQKSPTSCNTYLASTRQKSSTNPLPLVRLTGDHDTRTDLAPRITNLLTMIIKMGPIAT